MYDMNTFETSFMESIHQSSDEVILKNIKSSNPCPWTDVDFYNLLEQRLLELNISIRNLRTKLKNDYVSNLAWNINLANESRKVEEEFRLCNTVINCSDKKLISSDKLSIFFEEHFKDKNTKLQPEVIHAENYPHILPPHLKKNIGCRSEAENYRGLSIILTCSKILT